MPERRPHARFFPRRVQRLNSRILWWIRQCKGSAFRDVLAAATHAPMWGAAIGVHIDGKQLMPLTHAPAKGATTLNSCEPSPASLQLTYPYGCVPVPVPMPKRLKVFNFALLSLAFAACSYRHTKRSNRPASKQAVTSF